MFAYFLLLFIKCLNIYEVCLKKSKSLLYLTKHQHYVNLVAKSLWFGGDPCTSSVPVWLQGSSQGTTLAVAPSLSDLLLLPPIAQAGWLLYKLAAPYFW